MLKFPILFILLATLSVVFGCDTACSATSDRDGRCYYHCADNTCYMSGLHHRDEFLNGLSGRGYDCKAEGYNSLSCRKDDNFGGCWGHKWLCGKC